MKYTTRETEDFSQWLVGLKDREAKKAILKRLVRIQAGNFGDCESCGGGVKELRFHFGPGYRVYFTIRGNEIIYLLTGGTKKRQQKDIDYAKELADGL
jgi:putative addiction module killer protein